MTEGGGELGEEEGKGPEVVDLKAFECTDGRLVGSESVKDVLRRRDAADKMEGLEIG